MILWMQVVNLMLFHREIGACVDIQEVFRRDVYSVYIPSIHCANNCTCISKVPRGPMYSAFWFTPLLLCSSRGGLWLAFPSWAHLKFPGSSTDNKGAVTLRTSAAKCSPRVLGRVAQSVQKCLLSAPELGAEGDSSVPRRAAAAPLDHGSVPIFTASSALSSVSCWNCRSEVLWRARDCTKVLKELRCPRAPH